MNTGSAAPRHQRIWACGVVGHTVTDSDLLRYILAENTAWPWFKLSQTLSRKGEVEWEWESEEAT